MCMQTLRNVKLFSYDMWVRGSLIPRNITIQPKYIDKKTRAAIPVFVRQNSKDAGESSPRERKDFFSNKHKTNSSSCLAKLASSVVKLISLLAISLVFAWLRTSKFSLGPCTLVKWPCGILMF